MKGLSWERFVTSEAVGRAFALAAPPALVIVWLACFLWHMPAVLRGSAHTSAVLETRNLVFMLLFLGAAMGWMRCRDKKIYTLRVWWEWAKAGTCMATALVWLLWLYAAFDPGLHTDWRSFLRDAWQFRHELWQFRGPISGAFGILIASAALVCLVTYGVLAVCAFFYFAIRTARRSNKGRCM